MTNWVSTPEITVELHHGKGASVVTGPVRIAYTGNGRAYVNTRAHNNDDAPAVTCRGRDYLVSLHFVQQADGTWAEHADNRGHDVSPRGSYDYFKAAASTIRAAIVEAIQAAVAEHASADVERAAAHAQAAQRLVVLEPELAKLREQVAVLEATVAAHRDTLAATAPPTQEAPMSEYQAPTAEQARALGPGSKVKDAQGRTHTLNNAVTEVETESGRLVRASGYSREADGWLDMLTGKVKSGPWLEAPHAG